MAETTWRDTCRPIIGAIIDHYGTDDMPRLRRNLRAGFPFGERTGWPYKIWLDEIRKQLKLKPPHKPDPNQTELF